MKSLRLNPVRHEAPTFPPFEDRAEVLRYERAVRVHRAFVERFEVTPEGPIDGTYRVVGTGAREYLVDLVDGSGRHDTCTCPDFLANELGTCKHVQAVYRAVRSVDAAKRALARLPAEPKVPTVTVNAEGEARLAFVGPWTSRLRALIPALPGLGPRQPAPPDPDRLVAGLHDGYRVVHAAPVVADRRRRATDCETRRAALEDSNRLGRLNVDVLATPLFPYQRDGVVHLAAGGRALLADDMGLGKTVQAIAACEVLRARGEARRILVVTPASLKHQWAREIERHARCRAVVVGGSAYEQRAAYDSDAPYKVLSYEMTWKQLSRIRGLDADVLILDEAQRARNFRTKTAATLRDLPSRFLFVLTGTPVENRLDDLYALLQLVDPAILGPLWRFNHTFHQQSERGRVTGCKNLGELRRRTAPAVLRRRKEEVLDQLPELTEQTRYCPLTAEQAELEHGFRSEAAQLMARAQRRPLSPHEQKILSGLLLKARQACDALELADPARGLKASPKLEEFEALVAEIAGQGNSKVLVFSEWVEMLKLAASRLERLGIGYAMLTGDVPVSRRPGLLDDFRADSSQRVLLSTDAGGVGLNLQVANYVVHLDLPWNPAKLDQRTSRAHRLGQSRGVSVTYLCSETGIERGIEGTLAGKRAVRSAALDAASDVDDLEGTGFTLFLRQMAEALEKLAAPGQDVEVVDATPPVPQAQVTTGEGEAASEPVPGPQAPAVPQPLLEPRPEPTAEARPAPSLASPAGTPAPAAAPVKGRAGNRLRFARIVLDAGFTNDAVRAAYDALASAVANLAGDGGGKPGHGDLVAVMYRDLVPAGRLSPLVPGVLARLHDLSTLETLGLDVDPALAADAVAEAESWVGRIAGPAAPVPPFTPDPGTTLPVPP